MVEFIIDRIIELAVDHPEAPAKLSQDDVVVDICHGRTWHVRVLAGGKMLRMVTSSSFNSALATMLEEMSK